MENLRSTSPSPYCHNYTATDSVWNRHAELKQIAYHPRSFSGSVPGLFDECRDIGMQGLQIRFMSVNHVTGGVKMHLDIALERTLNGQLPQLVHGGKIRCRKIVVATIELHFEVGVLLHRDREVRHDIDRTRDFDRRTGRLVQHVPELLDVEFRLVGLFLAEFEHGTHVIVERRYI